MTAEALEKRVACIVRLLAASEPANVTRPARVEAPPPPASSEAELRPQQSRAGASGWSQERREDMARRAAARNKARVQVALGDERFGQSAKAESQSAKAESPKRQSAPRAVSEISSPSVSSQNLSINPYYPPPSSGSSSPREAQSAKADPQSGTPKAPKREEEPKARHEEEGGGGVNVPREEERKTGREARWHWEAYCDGIRRAFPRPWTLDPKGHAQVDASLAGEVFGGFLDGSTEDEAKGWYREQCAAYVAHQLSDRPDLTFFRPEQFLWWLDHVAGPVGHASAERRKRAHLETQRALRGDDVDRLPDYTITLTDDATKSLADTLLGSLGSLGALRTGAAVTGQCERVDPAKRRAELDEAARRRKAEGG